MARWQTWCAVGAGALLFGLVVPSERAAAAPGEYDLRSDLVYATHGGEKLRLDIALPKGGKGRLPGVVLIHGGGWAAGSRKLHVDLIERLAARGYVAATVSYRFAPLHPWPAQIHDVKAAVRYLRENADTFRLDPSRVGAMGFSAGAHLALLLGSADPGDGLEGEAAPGAPSSKVQAVVAWFGPTDLGAEDYPAAARRLIEGLLGPAARRGPGGASPISFASRGDAATLIFHGTKDAIVPVTQATLMADALTQAGVKGEVVLLLGEGHGWGGDLLARTAEDSWRWFDQHLKGLRPEAR
jgi:acetyl esterase/lipase